MSKEYNIEYRRVIYKEKKKRVNIKLLLLIISLIVLLSFVVFFIYSYNQISSQVSGTGKAVLEASNSIYKSVAKIIGLSIKDAEQQEETPVKEPEETQGQETIETPKEETNQITEIKEQPEETQETMEEEPEENITEEGNITAPEETLEPAENATNITIPEANITGETNITVPINITLPENITELNITNETIPETNLTNITSVNKTIINETFVNETAITENITALNITTKQYKAVINRRVKWIKTVRIDNLIAIGNLTLELPKQAENITVKTGKEIQEALREIEQYEGVIDNTNRNNLITGKVTGYADLDIKNSIGILTRFWRWLTSLTMTGKVIQENELEEEITETSESKIIDLENIANQTQEEEIAVEYYTDAPTAEEIIISGGKKVVVSAPTELHYTDILAYTLLDNRVSINNSDKIKVYWIKTEITEQATQEQTTTEITESITLPIINEPTDNETELINNKTVEEEQATAEATNKTLEEEQATNEALINETESEQASEQQASPITAFAINEDELNNENNSSLEINNLTDNQLLENDTIENNISEQETSQTQTSITRTTREEINFTAYDLDEDGLIDYIEWDVPHLSNQTYEIIYITKAEHLDENYTFIKDVYEQVKALDDNWTLIPDGDYLRVSFEKPLDKTKDITIYARIKDNCSVSENENNSIIINGTEVPCDIYQKKKRIDEIRRLLGE